MPTKDFVMAIFRGQNRVMSEIPDEFTVIDRMEIPESPPSYGGVTFTMRPAFWLDENWEVHWDDD